MRSKWMVPVALLLIVAGFTALSAKRPRPEPPLTQATIQAETGIPVELVDVRIGSADESLSVTGQLAADYQVNLSPKVAGKVSQILVEEGSYVAKGAPVVRLDSDDAARQMQQARAGVEQAKSGVKVAEARLAQAQTGREVGDVTSFSQIAQAEAGLKSAEANLEMVTTGARKQERQHADNAVAIAKTNQDKALSDFRRYKALFEQGAVSAATLEAYETGLKIAQANYNSAVQARSLVEEGARNEQVRQAEAAVRNAREAVRSARAASKTNEVRAEDVLAAKAGVASAYASLSAARAALATAEQNVRNHTITAPRSGWITQRFVETGQYIGPGTPVVSLVDLGTIVMKADISETDMAKVRAGLYAAVRVDALGNRVFAGRVESLIASADPGNRSFTARIRIDNPEATLRPNMFARADIAVRRIATAMLVPKSALVNRNGGTEVVSVVDDKAEFVDVRLGLVTGDDIVVESESLKPGDRIVPAGQDRITDGAKVKPE
ncbi:MAG: efflux RND transporter periplasmic adaptor subunit [Armatimonadetes bacterium]|nr:efflux RND transporter periplasmic adaptor subunit [Armatimonadota bacterium]